VGLPYKYVYLTLHLFGLISLLNKFNPLAKQKNRFRDVRLGMALVLTYFVAALVNSQPLADLLTLLPEGNKNS